MPFDSFPEREFGGGEPWWHQCKSCKRPIAANDPIEHLRFEPDPVNRLEEMNGTYHAACAKPFVSVIRALNALQRWG